MLGVLTVGRRTGGAGVEPGWVWSRSVPVEPQDSSGAVVILPAPSCVLFTMLVDVVDMLVDIVDMCGFVLRHECIVDQ